MNPPQKAEISDLMTKIYWELAPRCKKGLYVQKAFSEELNSFVKCLFLKENTLIMIKENLENSNPRKTLNLYYYDSYLIDLTKRLVSDFAVQNNIIALINYKKD